ncbi:MAG: glucoamylase family protein, partial [Lacipirellulaceae bacterium]
PQAFGVDYPPIDWFENSRRALLTHRQRCLEAASEYKSFGPNRWGMSPAADLNEKGEMSYIVQSIRPSMEGTDNFCGGTVTPYAAGSAIMFMPEESVAALREFRNLKNKDGEHIVWRPLEEGGYGLLDSFNLDREEQQGTPDYLSIDDGPMILAIENARTGLIWDLFMRHPAAQRAVERLKWKREDAID